MGTENKNRANIDRKYPTQSTKILGWEISESYKKKLITWIIEGLIISAITFAILWLPLIN